jgi:hypothetical protein
MSYAIDWHLLCESLVLVEEVDELQQLQQRTAGVVVANETGLWGELCCFHTSEPTATVANL